MPTYNGMAYLASALDSILSQRDEDIEIIAVDDGSSDGTLALLHAYARQLPLRIYSNSHVGNWVANTNYALKQARAPYLCFLHQDDLWLPNRLRHLRRILARQPDTALLVHPAQYIDDQGCGVGLWRCPLKPGQQSEGLFVERLLVQNFIAIPCPLFSRSAAMRIGGLNEHLWYTADWDFWLRLAHAGSIWYHSRPLAAFRIHTHSQTAKGVARSEEMFRQMETVLQEHLSYGQASASDPTEVGLVAKFSVEINHALAVAANGGIPNWRRLTSQWIRLGLSGNRRFLRDSRILERLGARLWAQFR
jgi:hypothetical protein